MTRCLHKGVSFEPPRDWVDATVITFHAPLPGPGGPQSPAITMTREALEPGDTLATYAARKLVKLVGSLQDFDTVETEQTAVAGRPAMVRRFRFKAQKVEVEQITAMIDPGPDPSRTLTTLSCAYIVPLADAARAQFADVLKSIQFEGADAAMPVPPQPHLAPPPRRDEPSPPTLPLPQMPILSPRRR